MQAQLPIGWKRLAGVIFIVFGGLQSSSREELRVFNFDPYSCPVLHSGDVTKWTRGKSNAKPEIRRNYEWKDQIVG
jgi:hypothetical protein